MGPEVVGQDTDDTLGDWTYRETIDDEASTIRVRGHVDRLGADLLRATIEELDRRGHEHITVTIERSSSVDRCAQVVLAETAARLAGRDSRLTVRWAAACSRPSPPVGGPAPGALPTNQRRNVSKGRQ
jgi:hypothetical protein